jgi:pyruvate/2-oxoglutarate/acetoin dehydrogenase E1 component
MNRVLKFTEAIHEATAQSLAQDARVYVLGLGVSYKNGADGTMGDLKTAYPSRILDTPVSEGATTGAAVGSAISGSRPIIHHGRVEFALFAADQIITQASKWNYMFGGDYPVPIVFRIAVGRQWGNGPQHTQALYSLFGNVVGLKVVIPSTPKMAKGLLISAVQDNNPVVFLEPRWLYQIKGNVDEAYSGISLSRSRIVKDGTNLTIVAYGDGLLDSYKAALMVKEYGINVEVVDLVSINPIDVETICLSVKKTRRLLCVDTTNSSFCVGNEIIGRLLQRSDIELISPPKVISCPNIPCPTAPSLTDDYYPTKKTIANTVLEIFGFKPIMTKMTFQEYNLAPTDVLDI